MAATTTSQPTRRSPWYYPKWPGKTNRVDQKFNTKIMKNKLFQSFKVLLCLIWLYVLSSTALFGQSINLMNLGNGFVKAEVSGTCSTALTLNWGDGCQNTNPINPLIHRYLTCGKFIVTLTCSGSGGNMLLASVYSMGAMPYLVLEHFIGW